MKNHLIYYTNCDDYLQLQANTTPFRRLSSFLIYSQIAICQLAHIKMKILFYKISLYLSLSLSHSHIKDDFKMYETLIHFCTILNIQQRLQWSLDSCLSRNVVWFSRLKFLKLIFELMNVKGREIDKIMCYTTKCYQSNS